MNENTRRVEQFLNIVSDLGCELNERSRVLDFGCGNGNIVNEYSLKGYQAFGCDIAFKQGEHVERLKNKNCIRLIEPDPYRLPFEDNYFDFVASDQVFEHVNDYSSALNEIMRVLRPGGFSLHIFPSRYRIIETHVHIPFASIIKNYWWLLMWTSIGARRKDQAEIPRGKIAMQYYEYLQKHTNYLSASEITKHVSKYFGHIKFCEKEFLKYSERGSFAYALSGVFPLLPQIYSTFFSRVIFLRK